MTKVATDPAGFPLIVSAAALLDPVSRVLVQRRLAHKPMPGLWEFPGGKLEPGETPEAALVRELSEELAIGVDPEAAVPIGFTTGTAGGRQLLLLLFAVHRWRGEPRALSASELRWISPPALAALAMPPADLPLIAPLAAYVGTLEARAGIEPACKDLQSSA